MCAYKKPIDTLKTLFYQPKGDFYANGENKMENNCPNCSKSFEGELIYQTFLKKYNDPKKALEVAELYGATEYRGCWSLKIGNYDFDKDRVISWSCPFCNHTWKR